jgi:septum formation protein
MLRQLSNRSHEVHTGIAVVTPTTQRSHVETTTVFFSPIPEADLAHYLSTNDSLDKAGAYGIQGYAARWIPRIEGDFFNVVGLPLAAVLTLLRDARAI